MDANTTLAIEIKASISIVSLLTKLGYTHKRKSGKELIYQSMLRDNDSNPSLCVNEELGVWFDHGGANSSGLKGGNIIDFGFAYWRNLNFEEVLRKILEISNYTVLDNANCNPRTKSLRPRIPIKLPHYKIEDIKVIGTNPAITQYLQQRGIYDISCTGMAEVYYYVEDEKRTRKHYFAAGWMNDLGGWEVRNKYFKGTLGHKGITFLPRNNECLVVFEGYFNYLSWLKENSGHNKSALILNSLSMLDIAVNKAKGFPRSEVFFDRDPAGESAFKAFARAVPGAEDCSNVYIHYNDYNDKLVAQIRADVASRNFGSYDIFKTLKVTFSR